MALPGLILSRTTTEQKLAKHDVNAANVRLVCEGWKMSLASAQMGGDCQTPSGPHR